MVNMHSADWIPFRDLDGRHQPPQTSQQKACVKRMASGGLATTASEYPIYYALCSNLAVYLAAARLTTSLAGPAIARAIGSLGSSLGDIYLLNQASRWGPNKHFGPTTYRASTYNTTCSCFQYVGRERPLPLSAN
jgi:hypothetical protein